MRVMMVGGGTAGHVTPILAVAEAVVQICPTAELSYVGPRGDKNAQLVRDTASKFHLFSIHAGKFRRYHNRSLLTHILDAETNWLNFIDFFKLIIGALESFVMLIRYRPDVIFAKGGFVVVPVCTAARVLRIPYITHDSDMVVGLANRIIAPGALYNAVASSEVKAYSQQKTIVTGIPLKSEYYAREDAAQATYKQKLGIATDSILLFVISGTQGATRIDDAVEAAAPDLLQQHKQLVIVHVFGRLNEHSMHSRYGNLSEELRARLVTMSFVDAPYDYIAASDIVVLRAGATLLAECAAIGRALVVIPADALTGGQQVKNAELLEKAQTARVIREKDLNQEYLTKVLNELIGDPAQRLQLAHKLRSNQAVNGAAAVAKLLLAAVRGGIK